MLFGSYEGHQCPLAKLSFQMGRVLRCGGRRHKLRQLERGGGDVGGSHRSLRIIFGLRKGDSMISRRFDDLSRTVMVLSGQRRPVSACMKEMEEHKSTRRSQKGYKLFAVPTGDVPVFEFYLPSSLYLIARTKLPGRKFAS
eukprot:IDg2214t1